MEIVEQTFLEWLERFKETDSPIGDLAKELSRYEDNIGHIGKENFDYLYNFIKENVEHHCDSEYCNKLHKVSIYSILETFTDVYFAYEKLKI
jgi:hypothetical protein